MNVVDRGAMARLRCHPRACPRLGQRLSSIGELGAVSKGRLDMRSNLGQNGKESFEELRETPKGSSTILRFGSDEGIEFPSEPERKQRDPRLARSPCVRRVPGLS